MQVYSCLQIGEYHINHCEDFLYTGQINHDITVCAVMDGCTMGEDSHLISTMTGKLLRKIVTEKAFLQTKTNISTQHPGALLREILQQLFTELSTLRNQLLLNKNELLSTLILGVFDENINKGALLAIGDGVIAINGRIMEFDHNNQPDYIGNHLSKDFEQWFEANTQKLALSTLRDISLATDGILSFKRFNQEVYPAINPVEFLLTNEILADQPDMLSKKLKSLEHNYGLRPTDDIAVIRVLFKPVS
jgi:hypothetical protein